MKRPVIIICGLLLLSTWMPGAHADMTGATDAAMLLRLTKIYQAIQEQYENQLKLIKEAKVQSENLQRVKEMAVMAKKEYDFARNFNLDREIARIKSDIGGLTLLDNLDGQSPERQFDLLVREVNRRFESQESRTSAEAKRRLASRLASLQRLMTLQQSMSEEAEALTSGTQTNKEVQASAASSCALIAALELAREQRRIEQEIQKIDQQHQKEALVNTYDQVLERMAEKP